MPFNYLPAEFYGIFKNYSYVAVIMGILAYGVYRLKIDLIKSNQNREVVVAAVCIIIFWLWVASGLGIAYANDSYTIYGFEKFRNYTVLLVLPSFTLLFLINSRFEEKGLLFNLALIWLSLIIIKDVVYLFILLKGNYDLSFLLSRRLDSAHLSRLAGIDTSKHFFSNPIWIARQISYCLLCLSFVSLWYPGYKRIMSLVLLLTGVFLMIWAGSRGSIIAFLGGYTFLIVKRGLGKSYKQLIIYAVVGIALGIAMITVVGHPNNVRLFYKSIRMIKGELRPEENSVGIRTTLYKNVLAFKKHPAANIFGMGLGSYDFHSDKINATPNHYKFPHNILLEIYFELGWVGIFLFICVFIVLPLYLYRVSPYKTGFVIVSVAIYICVFINSMFSGDLKGNEMLPKMLMLLSVAVVNSKNSALANQGNNCSF